MRTLGYGSSAIFVALFLSLVLIIRKKSPNVKMPNCRLKRSNDTHCGKYTIGGGGPPPLPKPTRYVNKKMRDIV